MRTCLRLGGPAKALLSSLSLILTVGSLLLAPTQAYGEQPRWTISSDSAPTSFVPGDETGEDKYVLTVVNSGSATAGGSPIEIADTLPSGIVAESISGKDLGNGQALSCRLAPTLGCSYEGFEIASGDVLQVDIAVNVGSGVASPAVNSAIVTGGGALDGAAIEDPTPIGSTEAGFGISSFATAWSDTEAGSSVNLTAGFTLHQILAGGGTKPAASPKDLTLDLPPGFVVNPKHIQRCSVSEAQHDECHTWAAVGVAFTSSSSSIGGTPIPYSSLIYSVEPEPGELGGLMLTLPSGPIELGLRLSAGGGYHVQLQAKDLPQVEPLLSMTLTLWGIPGASAGPDHVLAGEKASFGGPGSPVSRFLTTAGNCSPSPPSSRLSVTSWTEPASAEESSSDTPSLTGCDRLPFTSSFSVDADTAEASEPSGYEMDLHFSQSTDPSKPADADVRTAAVALPEGVNISISAADGLLGCSEVQIGLGSQASVTCPDASKIGLVEIETQLLSHPLQGAIYLAAQGNNPFGAPFAVYIVAEDPFSTASIKLAGELDADPVTGRLTLTLPELPQLPISGLHLRFFGGARALLTTPGTCGDATSAIDLTPWSGSTSTTYSSSFEIDAGPNGGSCEAGLFNPTFQAGDTLNGAGAYTSFVVLSSRASGEEDLGGIEVRGPAAVASMFTGVPVCGEPEASEGACPASSEVGTVAAAVGLGPVPYYLSGAIYLTGPYRGAPQGLAIVMPLDVGPFTLGTVLARAAVQIVAGSGQLTIAGDRLPTVVDGIPLHLGKLALQLDRGTFSLNPDGCEPLTVLATVVGARGGSKSISATPFGETPPCKSASSPATTSHKSAVLPACRVSLASTRIVARSDGRAIVKLRCVGTSPCRGKLTLTVRTKTRGRKRFRVTTVGAADFAIPPGDTRDIKLKLSATARFRLKTNHGRLNGVRLKIVKSSPAPAEMRTTDVSLVRESSRRRRPATS